MKKAEKQHEYKEKSVPREGSALLVCVELFTFVLLNQGV